MDCLAFVDMEFSTRRAGLVSFLSEWWVDNYWLGICVVQLRDEERFRPFNTNRRPQPNLQRDGLLRVGNGHYLGRFLVFCTRRWLWKDKEKRASRKLQALLPGRRTGKTSCLGAVIIVNWRGPIWVGYSYIAQSASCSPRLFEYQSWSLSG